jgi:Skp family chaperone for outer membrane proteins
MPEKATAEATLKTVSDKYQQEYQNLQTEFEKKYKDFQALGADTPQTIKDRRMQETSGKSAEDTDIPGNCFTRYPKATAGTSCSYSGQNQ